MGILKGTKLNSILTGKCPVCQNESMYKNSNPYILSETLKMHERCSHCGTKYKIEPSFFYGAVCGCLFGFAFRFRSDWLATSTKQHSTCLRHQLHKVRKGRCNNSLALPPIDVRIRTPSQHSTDSMMSL